METAQPGQLDVIIDFFEKQRQAMREISGKVQCMNVVSKPGTDRQTELLMAGMNSYLMGKKSR